MQRMTFPVEETPPTMPSEGERASRALVLGVVLGMFLALVSKRGRPNS
jgi:hypothetical protein